jgi:L-aspartate oxidase
VRTEVGRIMWTGCGLERDAEGLAIAAGELDALPRPATPEAANLLDIARLAVRAAALREESRGAHFRTDFPDADPTQARRTAWAGDQPHHLKPADMATPTNNFTEAV